MAPPNPKNSQWMSIVGWIIGVPAALAVLGWLFLHGHQAGESTSDAPKEAEKPHDTVSLASDRWKASGIALESVVAAPFVERHWRTGRLAVDEGREGSNCHQYVWAVSPLGAGSGRAASAAGEEQRGRIVAAGYAAHDGRGRHALQV